LEEQVEQAASITLPKGGRATINVTFHPVLATVATGTVTVRLVGASAALGTIALRGEGVVAVSDFGIPGPPPPASGVGGTSRSGVALTLGLVVLALVGRRRR